MRTAKRFFISGMVQGVGFRFFTQRAAARHQVVGYVKNLSDGRVEIWAEGNPPDVEAFKNDIRTGPKYSQVQEVEELVVESNPGYSAFIIEA